MSDGCVLWFWEMGLSPNPVTDLNNQHVGFLSVRVVSKTNNLHIDGKSDIETQIKNSKY